MRLALPFILGMLFAPGPPEDGWTADRSTDWLEVTAAIEESRAACGGNAVQVSLPDWFPVGVARAGVTWVTGRLVPPEPVSQPLIERPSASRGPPAARTPDPSPSPSPPSPHQPLGSAPPRQRLTRSAVSHPSPLAILVPLHPGVPSLLGTDSGVPKPGSLGRSAREGRGSSSHDAGAGGPGVP